MAHPAHPYFEVTTPTVLGHRGAAGDAPENTLPSFERALAVGAHILESDVHCTRDGVPVLLHDPTVDRTTDGTGSVEEMDFSELRALDAGYRFTARAESADSGPEEFPFRGQGVRIPSLEEAFEAFPDARFNLEIKSDAPGAVERTVALVTAHRREERTLLTAGENPIMAKLREELGLTGARPALGASLADILEVVRAATEGRAPATDSQALQIPSEFAGRPLVTRELVTHAHAHGIAIHVWTINERAEVEALLALGCDGVVTDYPGRVARWLARG